MSFKPSTGQEPGSGPSGGVGGGTGRNSNKRRNIAIGAIAFILLVIAPAGCHYGWW